MTDQLPKESRAQEIGHRAALALTACQPLGWRHHSLEGTDDAGLDIQIQVIGGQQYRDIFRLQLKGTESREPNAAGEFFSVPFKASTLNYYDRIIEPVLIVLADLSQQA